MGLEEKIFRILITITDKTILLLDSWSAHKDDNIFSSLLHPCQRYINPPKTTSLIQPLDRYGLRQWEVFVKRIIDYANLEELPINLKTRLNIITMDCLMGFGHLVECHLVEWTLGRNFIYYFILYKHKLG
jgi:hypothetical protein